MLLARLYVLGEKYQDALFENGVIDAMIAKNNDNGWSPTGPDIDILYSGTCAGSPVRRLMVDMHMGVSYSKWIRSYVNNNHEFLEDLCVAMLDDGQEQREQGGRMYDCVSNNSAYNEVVE